METLAAPRRYTEAAIDHNKQTYEDMTTLLAEAVESPMRTPFEFTFDGSDLFAGDGRPLTPIFDEAITEAEQIAEECPELDFEIRRRQHDRDELDDMLAMARGELPNTMVVVSDFPSELMNATKDVGGYNVTRQQTMLRVLTWRDGRMNMYSQSLDGSDRRALEALYAYLGRQVQPGELLGQRIRADLPPDEQDLLTDKLTGVYDASIAEQRGGEWDAGRPRGGSSKINSYDFVRAQHDLVQNTLALHRFGKLDEATIYDTIALINERLEAFRGQTAGGANASPDVYASPFVGTHQELQAAGQRARTAGKTFSACGVSIGVGAEVSAEEQLAGAGYGNGDTLGVCEFTSKTCPVCKKKDVRTRRTSTRIVDLDHGCVRKL